MKYGTLALSTIDKRLSRAGVLRSPQPGNLPERKLPERITSPAGLWERVGERAAVKRKLSTSAVLATVAGTLILAPLGARAQQSPPAQQIPQPTADAQQPASDPAGIISGTVPGATQAQLDEAAQRLLSRKTPESIKLLRDALITPNPLAQLAVARAISVEVDPDPSFVNPLFPLLNVRDVAAAAGRALAGYQSDPEVLTRLIETANSRRNTPEFTQLAAIRGIGAMPEKRAAAALMYLLGSRDESGAVHITAAEALINLTGLEQNGTDATRWTKWWSTAQAVPDATFRTDILARQGARSGRLNARYDGLVGEVNSLLRDEYEHRTKTAEQRQELMLTFLNSSHAEIRQIGAGLLSEDVSQGNVISNAELQQLRYLIGDSSPEVRRSVADALVKINDPKALDALLRQLTVEPDPMVRAAIATALGPIHDLSAVKTLTALLQDDSLPTAQAAAVALEDLARGPLAADPAMSRSTAEALRDTILARSRTPGADDLRSACIEALAPLHQSGIIRELIDHKLQDAGKEASVNVRRAMLMAIGELNDASFADLLDNSLGDPAPSVQRQAIESLSTNPAAAEKANVVGSLLNDPSRDNSVRDEAWRMLQGVFPKLNEQQLSSWQDRLKNQPDPRRRLVALQALAEKQSQAKETDDLATTDAQIGEVFNQLKDYVNAASSYQAALKIYDQPSSRDNVQATLLSLTSAYLHALLDGGKYADAIALAAERIGRDPSEQGSLVSVITEKAEQLMKTNDHDDLVRAQQLMEQSSKMFPSLDGKQQERLKSVAADVQRKSSSLDNSGPQPQSATADGK